MSQRSPERATRPGHAMEEPPRPRVDHLVTEDGEAVDSFLSEKQMRILTTPLYAAWKPGRPFVVAANVGVFVAAKNPAIVPDVLVSLDVEAPALTGSERVRSYFVWELGKVPDIVVEIVSDSAGGELTEKLRAYERMRVPHYVVFDPLRKLGAEEVMTFSLDGGAYTERAVLRFTAEGLALTLWEGSFEGVHERWLRWTDLAGRLFPTPEESQASAETERAHAATERARADAEKTHAETERVRADLEKTRADSEKTRADRAMAEAERERQRAEALVARLRALGVEPED